MADILVLGGTGLLGRPLAGRRTALASGAAPLVKRRMITKTRGNDEKKAAEEEAKKARDAALLRQGLQEARKRKAEEEEAKKARDARLMEKATAAAAAMKRPAAAAQEDSQRQTHSDTGE